jgi:acetyltransferase-like isoleucine patch superfamily enzyme
MMALLLLGDFLMHLFTKIYLKFFIKNGFEYAMYLKRKHILSSQGENCYIAKSASIPDPYLTKVGNNVWITMGCNILCHDASVIMINIATQGHLDRVGPITIGDNSFLGNNVTVLPGISIGSNTIIGVGSIVTNDIPDNSVCAGNPARIISSFEDYLTKIKNHTEKYPWKDILTKNKVHVFDKTTEPTLRSERIKYFFGQQ